MDNNYTKMNNIMIKRKHLSLKDCTEFLEKKTISEWIDFYLFESWNNCRLSREIHSKVKFITTPTFMDFEMIDSTYDPNSKIFPVNQEEWKINIAQINKKAKGGYQFAPLIVEYIAKKDKYELRDWNHRMSVLKSIKEKWYYVIPYYNSLIDLITCRNYSPQNIIIHFKNTMHTSRRDEPAHLLHWLFSKYLHPLEFFEDYNNDHKLIYNSNAFAEKKWVLLCISEKIFLSEKNRFDSHIEISYNEYQTWYYFVQSVIDKIVWKIII